MRPFIPARNPPPPFYSQRTRARSLASRTRRLRSYYSHGERGKPPTAVGPSRPTLLHSLTERRDSNSLGVDLDELAPARPEVFRRGACCGNGRGKNERVVLGSYVDVGTLLEKPTGVAGDDDR